MNGPGLAYACAPTVTGPTVSVGAGRSGDTPADRELGGAEHLGVHAAQQAGHAGRAQAGGRFGQRVPGHPPGGDATPGQAGRGRRRRGHQVSILAGEPLPVTAVRHNGVVTGDASGTGIDSTVPHSARIWNYWLGGKDNYAVDRLAGEQTIAVLPEIVDIARASRGFLTRVVRYLAAEAGIRQFLDVGTGLPTADNTHEVAQRVAPAARVVYVDNDPLVLTHARALLTGSAEGATDYIEADAREVEVILRGAAATLDFTRPVAVTMLGILPFIGADDEARGIVRRLLAAVPAGSYLAITHSTSEASGERVIEAVRQWNAVAPTPYTLRSPAQIAAFFEGLELIEPGLVPCPRWRPDPDDGDGARDMDEYCALGRK
jgi:S-adenosyl methyltransferase